MTHFRRSSSSLVDADRDDLDALIDVSAANGGKDSLFLVASTDTASTGTVSVSSDSSSSTFSTDALPKTPEHAFPVFRTSAAPPLSEETEELLTLKRANPVVSDDEDDDCASPTKRARTLRHTSDEDGRDDLDDWGESFLEGSLDSCYSVCSSSTLLESSRDTIQHDRQALFAACSFGSDFLVEAPLRRSSSTISIVRAI